jgi:nucleoside-diphosphate-sugar epimerase
MRVFVTGATGVIGSAIVQELVSVGHQVVGLARSDAGAQSHIDAGAEVHRGDLEDLESLRSGAAVSDGVIHTAFNHDFSKFAANCEMDKRAIEALGAALASSDRPFVVTSGTGLVARGRLATKDDMPTSSPTSFPEFRNRQQIRWRRGVSAFVGDGLNRWPAVHRLDAAHLYRLALEKASAGAR